MTEIADRRTYGAGDIIFREGSTGDNFFLIEKGMVEISKKDPSGGKVVLGKIGVGGIFGEMAIIDDKPRMATASSLEHSVVRVIPRGFLEKKIAGSDRLVQAIIKMFIQNIRTITDIQIAKAMSTSTAPAAAAAEEKASS